jgi:hypothetical protein
MKTAVYGVASYSNYDAGQSRDTSLLEQLIASNKEVVISVDLYWSANARGVMVPDVNHFEGSHAFCSSAMTG